MGRNKDNELTINRDEKKRVDRLLKEAKARPHLIESAAKIGFHNKRKLGSKASRFAESAFISGAASAGHLSFSNAIALGDAVRAKIVRDEEFRAQHGPVKILFKNGKPVEQT